MMSFVRPASIALLLALPASASLSQQARVIPAGEGVFCAWAIYGALAEVAERCPVATDEALNRELRRTVTRLETYVLANSEMTAEQVTEFKSEQSQVGAPTEQLCQGDTLDLYEGMRSIGVEELSASIDLLTARPGQPTWGTCL